MWSSEKVLLFIEDLHSNECLWNVKNIDYKDHSKRKDVIQSLSKKYNSTVIDIDKKISNLKGQFRRVHKKMGSRRRNGLSAKPTWFAYEPLSFLLQVESRASWRDFDNEELLKNQIDVSILFSITLLLIKFLYF